MGKNTDLLRGWKEIEAYARMSRKCLLRHGYPVRREGRGWLAFRSEIDAHLRKAGLDSGACSPDA